MLVPERLNGEFKNLEYFEKSDNFIKMVNVEQTNRELSHPDLFYDLSVEKEIRESVSDNYYGFVKRCHIKYP